MTRPAMHALGLLLANALLTGAREAEGWAWATYPDTPIEELTDATRRRMQAQDQVNRARTACGLVPEEEQ